MNWHSGCRISGSLATLKYHCLSRWFTYSVRLNLAFLRVLELRLELAPADLCRRHSQVGSLAGAVHLLKDNAGVPRWAQWEQKSHVDQKGKSSLDFDFQYEYKLWKDGLSILSASKIERRGVRKVTTGITGLWQPSVHSDVAFWSFDVGSSYHCEAEFAKCWIVHPLIGNVSWV